MKRLFQRIKKEVGICLAFLLFQLPWVSMGFILYFYIIPAVSFAVVIMTVLIGCIVLLLWGNLFFIAYLRKADLPDI